MSGHPHQPARLYHYTCSHGAEGIRRDREIKPASMLGAATEGQARYANQYADPLVWLTDMAPPVARQWLGLTNYQLRCDRLTHVFAVDDVDGVIWYMQYRKTYPNLRVLEHEPGVKPMHWYVAEWPLPVVGEALADGTVMPLCQPKR